jgi:hypothetical protein
MIRSVLGVSMVEVMLKLTTQQRLYREIPVSTPANIYIAILALAPVPRLRFVLWVEIDAGGTRHIFVNTSE